MPSEPRRIREWTVARYEMRTCVLSRPVCGSGLGCALALVAVLSVGASGAAAAAKANPEDAFAALFGAEEKRVAATSATRDDAQFAASLLAKTPALIDDPALTWIVCQKAYEYGIKDPDGFA